MKKALLSVLIYLLFSITLVEPFLVFADNVPINGFDYTNYYELEYIQASGTQYIDTGISANTIGGLKLKFNFSSYNSSYGGYFRVYGTSTQGFELYQDFTSSNKFFLKFGNYSSSSSITMTSGDNVVYINPTDKNIYVNNSVIGSFSTYTNITNNLWIFRGNDRYSYARIYYFEVYNQSSSLIHNYIPAERKSDGVYGFYDTITSTFYANSGSGSFIAGSRIIYTSTQYTISTAVSPSGSGTVSGGGTYDSGTVINLTATASSGYSFSQWSDGNTSNPRSVTVSSDETYTAVFEVVSTPSIQYTISTAVSPAGSGSVSGGGTYDEGTVVSLSATANNGYVFTNWSDNSTQNPRSITVSQNATYTAVFTAESVNPDPPTPPAGWTDWTDSDDSEYLKDITSNIDFDKIYWSLYRKRVIDSVNIFGVQMDVVSSINGSNLNHVYFTGSYYDNTITGLQSCNSSAYTVDNETHTIDTMVYVQPAVYGSLDMNYAQPGEDIIFGFGLDIQSGLSGNETYTSSHIENESQACRLVGMNTGDGSIDGTTLIAAGYQKKVITYNDGTLNGHTATFYVPGDEEFEFYSDMSFLDDLLEDLYVNITNNGKVFFHDEYELSIHGKEGYLMPEYGSVSSKAFIGNIFNFNGSGFDLYQNINSKFNLIPSDNTYAYFNNQFSTHITENVYDRNYVYLYWQGNRNPKWKFKTDLTQSSIGLTNVNFNDVYVYNSYGSKIGVGDSLTITSSNVGESGLTIGSLLYVNIDSLKFYQYKNNSLLNRFNQLGSMMYGWFNRIYQAIGNITGGNESNEIINNVIEDNDIDVDIEFNGLLNNVENYKDDIDLTLPEFNIPSDDVSGIQSLASSFKQIYQDVYIDNGLGLLIFIPLLLLVLRLIL